MMSHQATNLSSQPRSQQMLSSKVFESQRKGQFTDCCLALKDQIFGCHRVILSAASPRFERLFTLRYDKTPMIVLDDGITFEEVQDILKYCYTGKCEVPNNRLPHFREVCTRLEIIGLNFDSGADEALGGALNGPSSNVTLNSVSNEHSNVSSNEVKPNNLIDVNEVLPMELSGLEPFRSSPEMPTSALLPTFRPKLFVTPRQSSKSLKIITRKTAPLPLSLPSTSTPLTLLKLLPTKTKRSKSFKFYESESEEEEIVTKMFGCKFCTRTYSTKHAHYNHQRECESNPNKVVVQCHVCDLILKPSLMYNHKKKHNTTKQEEVQSR